MKLLIVDDEMFAVSGIMEGVNWDVLPFDDIRQKYSYAQAVETLEEYPADVVMCDIEMPQESGLDLIAWVNAHQPETVCLILSCHDEFDFARQAVRLKCFDYILKPTRYDHLTEVLKKAAKVVEEKHSRQVLESYGQQYIDRISGVQEENAEDAAEKAAHYIEEHLEEDISVREIADMVYVSPDHLTRIFKKRYQKTVKDYITQKRMMLAGELLKNPKMTVTMASDRVGYNNYSYFSEQFKRYYGMIPREYQAQYKKKQKEDGNLGDDKESR